MSEIGLDLQTMISQVGFPIAIVIYLLYREGKNYEKSREDSKAEKLRLEALTNTVLEIVKANTVSNTGLQATIQKLCEMINGKEH